MCMGIKIESFVVTYYKIIYYYPSNMKIMFFDTETTGLPPRGLGNPTPANVAYWPCVVQLSYIIYDTDTESISLANDFIIQMKSDRIIPAESTAIHGITNEMSQSRGVPIEEVLDDFILFLQTADLVVAHNYQFDKNMVVSEIIRLPGSNTSELKKKHCAFDVMQKLTRNYCTMNKSTKMCNIKAYSRAGKEYTKWPTQTELCKHLFDFEPINMHNAMNDVTICALNFYQMYFHKDIRDKCEQMNRMVKQLIPN